MNHRPVSLSEFFHLYRSRNEPLVLATIAHTVGSTYRKAGAQMLIAGDGSAAGLLSGGCLEADLAERASRVIETGNAQMAMYDTRSSDDLIWGIGLGCEGAMQILLTRLAPDNGFQPFAFAEECRATHQRGKFTLVTESQTPAYALGAAYLDADAGTLPGPIRIALTQPTAYSSQDPGTPRQDSHAMSARVPRAAQTESAKTVVTERARFLIVEVELPTRLLVLGAGPDAMPLVEVAGLMGWQVTVLDHRPAYAVPDRFPRARRVRCNPTANLGQVLEEPFDAAVVMSHHLISDQTYLGILAGSAIPYIGLLGPAPRRARLMSELGSRAALFGDRLYGPIGLDIGARTPQTIALAIVSEIQAVLAGRDGASFREKHG